MTQKREDILACTDNPVHPYEQVIRDVHTDSRQGTKKYHRWIYQVSYGVEGSFSFFNVTTYTRKEFAYPSCHCRDVYDEWDAEERECCYCLDYDDLPEPRCLCVTGDDWDVLETNRAFVVKMDTREIVYNADPSKVLPVWVLDYIRKGVYHETFS